MRPGVGGAEVASMKGCKVGVHQREREREGALRWHP